MPRPPPPPSEREPAVRPGALTALLHELAETPAVQLDGWDTVLRPGASVGRFELVRELGRGGFGVVWEARDRELGRAVALKAVRPGTRGDLREERLLREAEAAARLSHPNIVTLFDVGRVEQGPFLVLELLRGETLEARLARGPVAVPEALRIFAEIAAGIAHAHREGVVHRDLKPANVFLRDDGRVKVLDLGLAHAFGRRRQDGGTSGYMAPEQVEGAPEDERTDVWAMGAILFELLSGRRAFAEDKAVKKSAPTLEVPGVPALGELAARMLAAHPVDRPRDGGAVLEALGVVEREVERRPTATGEVRTRSRRGYRSAVALALGIAAALALSTGPWWWRRGSPPNVAERVVVAVADFGNETRDPDLDGLSGLLITALAESPRLRVLTRSRMFDLARQAGRESVERIDEPLAREVGRRAAAKALLLASVRRFDDVYAVELRALDPAGEAYLFTAREQVRGKRNVPGLVDALAARTRVALGEDEAAVRREGFRVAEAVTDLEAHRHYFLGLQRIDEYRFDDARAELGEAIRLDPGFAHAHLQLLGGQLGAWVALRERETHLVAALAHADRLPETDRLRLHAEEALLHARPDEAFQGFARVLERSPSDKRTLLRMYWLSMSPRGDLVAATSFAERALGLDPSWQPAQDALAIALVFRGEFARAEALAREWAERWPSAIAFSVLNGVLLHAARPEEALAAARRAESTGAPGGLGVSTLARTLVQLDRFEEAEALLRRHTAAKAAPPGAARMLPWVALYQGKRRETERLLARQEERGGTPIAWRVFLQAGDADVASTLALAHRALPEVPGGSSAAAFAVAGHAEAAAELLGKHDAGVQASYTVPPGTVSKMVEALRARDRGDVGGARRILEEVRRGPSRPASHAASFVLGEICFAAGEDACAVEALDQFQRHHWLFDVSAWAYPRSLFTRAAAEERMGRGAEARATIERLLAIWRKADPDLPLLADAKAMRKRLAAQPAADDAVRAARADSKVEAFNPSIAVLPFADLSPGKDQEYFADGVADEILNALTHVRGLKVAGRTSSFSLKQKNVDLRTIGRKLGVMAVLEGSVRKEGGRIRVTAQLVKAEDGFHLWSERYDRELTGIFAVQDEIARAVVAEVAPLLAGKPGSEIATSPAARPEAYDWHLVGKQALRQNFPAAYRRAAEAYEKAVAIDPAYAPAWAGLAFAAYWSDQPAPDRAMVAAERAVALDPSSADALTARGHLRALHRFDWDGAQSDFDRARTLHPENPDVLRRHAQFLLRPLGRFPEAIAAVRRATELDPLSPHAWTYLAQLHLATGDAEASRRAAERALEISPKNVYAESCRGRANLLLGRFRDALASAQRANALALVAIAHHELGHEKESRQVLDDLAAGTGRDDRVEVARIHAWRGERDRAFEWLEQALARHDQDLVWLKSDVLLRNLHADPRFAALLRKLKLPED